MPKRHSPAVREAEVTVHAPPVVSEQVPTDAEPSERLTEPVAMLPSTVVTTTGKVIRRLLREQA